MVLLLGIGILAVSINQITSQSSQASIVEGFSAQAFYAAESGAYWGLNQVIFDVDDRTIADANCAGNFSSPLAFSALGLQNCVAAITCTISSVSGNPSRFYTIRSEATCGVGDIFAQRIVEVSTYL